MPIIKSAKKKLRQDKKRTARNKRYELEYKKIINRIKRHKRGENAQKALKFLSEAYSAIDKAKKVGVIHKNKASRLKTAVSRMLKK